MTHNRIYEDYTDAEIELMEREFDAWLQWRDSLFVWRETSTDRLLAAAPRLEGVANAQHKTASC